MPPLAPPPLMPPPLGPSGGLPRYPAHFGAPRPLPPPPRQPAPPKVHRLSPQNTLLALGVLLILAAGATFLAVNWRSLPVTAQAGIIATLAALAFTASIPASRRTLTGTAEALALLGTGLLTVDLYGARALGLISPTAINTPTYSAIIAATIAVLTLLMTRAAPKVVTYGVITVIAGQLALPLLLLHRTTLPIILAALLAQVLLTLFLSAKGTPAIRRTGSITAATVLVCILLTGTANTLWGLLTESTTYQTAAVTCLAAATGIAILHKRPLPTTIPSGIGEAVCAAAAAFAIATTLPQYADWLTTAFATALAITGLLAPRRTGKFAVVLHTATITAAAVDIVYCMAREDLRQLGYLAAIAAVLAVYAALRRVFDPVPTTAVASLSAQLAIVLFASDGYINAWPAAIALAALATTGIAIACAYAPPRADLNAVVGGVGISGGGVGVGGGGAPGPAPVRLGSYRPLELVLLITAACAAVLAEVAAATTATFTATGVVLTLTAAPLVAYGMNPRRRPALPIAALLFTGANTAFMLAANAHKLEWYTLPPAILLLTLGILAWRNRSSWISLGPGLLVGLAPSTFAASTLTADPLTTGTADWLRATLVVAAAVALILLGVRRSLQAPFLIGAAATAKIAIAQLLDLTPLLPRWITLATAGLILLTTGATYERRLTQTKQATRWISNLR
ncbi:SCO7613 C-terminal domain-containing membrane protein [Kribbella sp. NPDC048928]|uniref:SCO7613 C-terminal domain-containing membrane protein n=1 Tax=Kribbella sp. NPDC048928 TaxID=3364111 RepID=UPI003715C7F5